MESSLAEACFSGLKTKKKKKEYGAENETITITAG